MNGSDKLQDGWLVNLGQAKYLAVLELQRTLVELRSAHKIPDLLLLTEHEPVITVGRRGNTTHILATAQELTSQGIQVYHVERGGEVTYHGPGQLLTYPVIHLAHRELGVRTFVNLLEQTVIQALATFDIQARCETQHRGVWVGGRKLAALGLAIRRWVSFHGFALNVSPNLDHFRLINPCGLDHQMVTSMAMLLEKIPSMTAVRDQVASKFTKLFPGHWKKFTIAELQRMIRRYHGKRWSENQSGSRMGAEQ